MDISLFTAGGFDFIFRWLHFIAGITWIGLLYYFNFVQTEYFKEAEDAHRIRRYSKAGSPSTLVVPLGRYVNVYYRGRDAGLQRSVCDF